MTRDVLMLFMSTAPHKTYLAIHYAYRLEVQDICRMITMLCIYTANFALQARTVASNAWL